jgi:RHS repeat-associated protein
MNFVLPAPVQAPAVTVNPGRVIAGRSPDRRGAADEAARRVEAWLDRERAGRRIDHLDGRVEAVDESGTQCHYRYDGRGDLVGVIEENGSRIGYSYDSRRRLTVVEHADGMTTRYAYDGGDRLVEIDDRGVRRLFRYDAAGRVVSIRHGDAGASVYRYDEVGRVVEARTARVSTAQRFDAAGRITTTQQTIDGVTLETRSEFDEGGRLARLFLPGSACPVRYEWDGKGRPASVALGDRVIARFAYEDARRTADVHLANGVVETTEADPIDGHPVCHLVQRDEQVLFERVYAYGTARQLLDDGTRRYDYDLQGRLVAAEDREDGGQWRYRYDGRDNRVRVVDAAGASEFTYDAADRLTGADDPTGPIDVASDRHGRPIRRTSETGQWTYRYNDAGLLVQVRHRGDIVARFTYDHKGRLVLAIRDGRSERYLYGPDDALLAVTDGAGRPLRLVVRTPLGTVAEIHGAVDAGPVFFPHNDERGTRHLVTDETGDVAARIRYCPFGVPEGSGGDDGLLPVFGGRVWYPEVGLYYYGARWYDPAWGRFLTPDTFTAAPDDERLVHPLWPGSRQVMARSELLPTWLKRPRLRNRYAYCGNDPLNQSDPSGNWSFGGVLLMLLGAIWTLPNTLFGLLVEITCLVGEVVRWLVFLLSFGNVSWETPGFDVAASGRLNAFALVFTGGWLGSFESLLGITFGNVFFVYKQWESNPHFSGTDLVFPPAYNGSVSLPRNQTLYEHELRHTNQYGWFGPFFHLALPIWGVYWWDMIINGYNDSWLENDAERYGGV